MLRTIQTGAVDHRRYSSKCSRVAEDGRWPIKVRVIEDVEILSGELKVCNSFASYLALAHGITQR
jgi:hypothetical protein